MSTLNQVDPTGLCSDSGGTFLVPGPCEWSDSQWVQEALEYIQFQGETSQGFSPVRGLEGVADFGEGAANAVVSGVTLGHVHVGESFQCIGTWQYDVGTAYGLVAVGLLGGAEADSQVLLDTNSVVSYNAATSLLGEGEQPVITQTIVDELQDLAARKGFSGAIPNGVGMTGESSSIGLRMQLLQTMRQFGSSEMGIYNDATIGATTLESGLPLITGDTALGRAVQELGGEWRPLPQ